MAQQRLSIIIAICAAVLIACDPTGVGESPRARFNDAAVAAKPRLSKSPRPSPTPSPSASPTRRTAGNAKPRPGPHGSQQFTGSEAVALTFDDGPSPKWTPKVLALLRRHRLKATFCMVGVEVKRHPKLVRDIVRDGHTLCNHSWDHDMRLGKRSAAYIKRNLARTNAAILAAAPGSSVPYFRQPGGMWTRRGVQVARGLGMTPLHWTVDPQDWRKPPASQIASFVRRETKRGTIVLLHDGGGDRSHTYTALRQVLPHLTRRFHLTAL